MQSFGKPLRQRYRQTTFKAEAAASLGGAVQIPTITYDMMPPVGEDPRFEIHGKLHEYLFKTFPLVHASFGLVKVNTYGLLYSMNGTDPTLKPLLLLAHQDVVPVNPDTIDEWTHPPFSGFFDGERIWGRGTGDDKSGLIGIMTALELLLNNGFKPKRTLVLSFGFDEEGGGLKGAGTLAPEVLRIYGENSMAMIVDEGGGPGGFISQFGTPFATPAIAEKGTMDLLIEVATRGGHSSVPPAHTSIGMLSRLLVEFEEHPFEMHLERQTPTYDLFQCYAEHVSLLPESLRDEIIRSRTSDEALAELEETVFQDVSYKSLIITTQAIDMIHGGVKSNALPEQAWAIINHRVSAQSSVGATKEHDTNLLISLAARFNLSYTAFGESLTEPDVPKKGSLTLSAIRTLDIAPVTPYSGKGVTGYDVLSGTIKATYNAHRSLEGDNIVVGPGMPSGNTDTRFYWKLTPHIFRYNHHHPGNGTLGAHTVDESISADAYVEIILFFTTLILNVDESTVV
ncbi:carboxypeptidase S [Hymenopellis radicata]|nr:carboxypeptidase S [Hymenopellis radicata]